MRMILSRQRKRKNDARESYEKRFRRKSGAPADLAGGGSETERKGVNGRKEKKRENGRSGSSQRKPAQGEKFT